MSRPKSPQKLLSQKALNFQFSFSEIFRKYHKALRNYFKLQTIEILTTFQGTRDSNPHRKQKKVA